MEKNHKIIIGVLIVIIAVLACLIAVFTLMPQEQQDNVIKIDGITFNTTNATNFTHIKKYDVKNDRYESIVYGDIENGTRGKCSIRMMQYYDKNSYQNDLKEFKEQMDTKYIIDGREVYLTSAGVGKYVGEPRYETIIYNAELNKVILIATPDANETVKIASTLKFN